MSMMRKAKCMAVCAMAIYGIGMIQPAAGEPQSPDAVASSIAGLDAAAAADVVAQAVQSVNASDLTDAQKRQLVIEIVAKAVAAAGEQAAPMMGLVIAKIAPEWVPVAAATAVVAAGESSPAVATAMVNALAAEPQLQAAARTAAAVPSSVLRPGEIGSIRFAAANMQAQLQGLPPPQAPEGGWGFDFIQPAQKYSGQ